MKYSALTWVKPTIDGSLKQTRQALEQFVENPKDIAPLQQCVGWLREIRGTLTLLELQTAALLVHSVEVVIAALLAGKLQNSERLYDVLMRSLVQLPNYLDHLLIVKSDMPLAVLPLINALRAVVKQAPLPANSLFIPDLSVSVPNAKHVVLPDPKLKAFIKQLRGAYQKGLIALIKQPKNPAGLKFIFTVLQRLQQVTGQAPISSVWWVAESIVEALLQKGLGLNNAIVTSFKQIDALLKRIMDHGNAALRLPPPKPVLTNLLYFAGHARSKGPRITAIKKAFNLQGYFPSEATLQAARLAFSGPDIELMKIVISLIKDDFTRVEESLDIFDRADNPSVTELQPLIAMIHSIANTLGLLGLLAQRRSMLQEAKLILDITEYRVPAEIDTRINIANTLLHVSSALDIMAVQGVHARQRLQQEPDTQFSDTPQFVIMLNIAVEEAKGELAKVTQPLASFIDTKEQDEALKDVPKNLKQVEGFLRISAHEHAAKILGRCTQYIEQTFIEKNTVPPEIECQALADVLIGLQDYLDTLVGSPMDSNNLLIAFEKRLKIISA